VRRLLLAALIATPLPAQQALQARYDSAYFAWQSGDYPNALARFERLLSSSEGAALLEPIALLTGEWYRTIVVTSDGAGVRWSADSRFASYTMGRVTYVVAIEPDSVRTVASVKGTGLVIDADGRRAAYFAIPETPELTHARALTDSLGRAGASNQRLAQQRNVVARLEREAARLMLRELQTGREREIPLPPVEKSALTFSPDGRAL
jgi:hypothetical protein